MTHPRLAAYQASVLRRHYAEDPIADATRVGAAAGPPPIKRVICAYGVGYKTPTRPSVLPYNNDALRQPQSEASIPVAARPPGQSEGRTTTFKHQPPLPPPERRPHSSDKSILKNRLVGLQ